jgi:hypothetical protein
LSFPRKRESRRLLKDWILAGVYPREDGGGNDNLDQMRINSNIYRVKGNYS